MRALVTGASGFVGNVLVRRLLQDGHEVHVLLRPEHNPARLSDLHDHLTVHLVDITDTQAVLETFQTVQPDWVFHLGVHGAYSYQSDAHTILQTNVIGTLNILQAAKAVGCQAVVQAGSSSEYGLKQAAPTEDTWLEPNSYYAVSKAATTHLAQFLAMQDELPVVTLRLYSVFGPYEEPTRLMPTLLVHALEQRLPPLVAPDTARDFIAVDDVVEAFLLAAQHASEQSGAVYNVASGTETTLGDLVDLVRSLHQVEEEPEWGTMPARAWDTNTWVGDASALRRDLGWQPQHTLESGLQAMSEWLRADGERWEEYRGKIFPET